jgi:hypothetical protein
MTYISNPAACRKSSNITARSTDNWRQWWATEAERIGSNWRSIFQLHCEIVDRLRATSSWAVSS